MFGLTKISLESFALIVGITRCNNFGYSFKLEWCFNFGDHLVFLAVKSAFLRYTLLYLVIS